MDCAFARERSLSAWQRKSLSSLSARPPSHGGRVSGNVENYGVCIAPCMPRWFRSAVSLPIRSTVHQLTEVPAFNRACIVSIVHAVYASYLVCKVPGFLLGSTISGFVEQILGVLGLGSGLDKALASVMVVVDRNRSLLKQQACKHPPPSQTQKR